MSDQMDQPRELKTAKLRASGIEPYPYRFDETHSISAIHEEFESICERQTSVSVAGRVLSHRKQGQLSFIDVGVNSTEPHIQLLGRRASLDEQSRTVLDQLDLGDHLGAHGPLMLTKRGERTVSVERIEMLSKSMRPLPKLSGHAGVSDPEYLARLPELAMLFGSKKKVLCDRAKIMASFRRDLSARGLVEIETPFLNPFFGGADARPFVTHVNALKMPVFLAVSPEIELKRAIVGGFDKGVCTFARNFRNEGVDATHNPEFTAMEAYVPNRDYTDMMILTENLVAEACKAVHGEYQCKYQDMALDFTPPWPRLKMVDLISKRVGFDVSGVGADELVAAARRLGLDQGIGDLDETSANDLRKLLLQAGVSTEAELELRSHSELKALVHRHHLHQPMDLTGSWGDLLLAMFERLVEPHLVQPCHVIDHPACSTVLCKKLRNGNLPNGEVLVERFESYAFRMEISNAYSELNDSVEQERLMRAQAELREAGREEAMPFNTLFIESLQYGMPPCGGLGIGMDRIVMLLTDSRSIRDVIAFPLVRP